MAKLKQYFSAILNFLFNPESKQVYSWWVIIGTFALLALGITATLYRLINY
jgi:hypothetical protein